VRADLQDPTGTPEPELSPRRHDPGSAAALTPRLILGLGVIAFGALLLLDNLNLVEAGAILRYLFPAVLLGVGATQLLAGSRWGWIWLVAGGWTLLDALDVIDLNFWQLFFPLVLVAAGFTMVRRGAAGEALARRSSGGAGDAAIDRDGAVHAFAFMSGNERRNDSAAFRGGDLFAFMGGVTLDLRHAATPPDGAVLDVFAMWGGIEIRVPESWRVISEVVPLLGGFEDKTKPSADPAAPVARLVIRGVVVMGGVEVRN
jgi:hypothetical protein